MKVVSYHNEYRSAWDKYVRTSDKGTIYHLTGWQDVIEKTFGLRSIHLMALSGTDKIKGIFPLFLMKDILGREHLVSSPFSNYAGICTDENQAKNELINKAKEIAVKYRVRYLEIRQLAEEIAELPTKKNFVAMFLKLENDEELIWKNYLKAKTRNQVRKAYRSGLTVHFGRSYFDDFYKILSINLRDLGTPIYPKKFFRNILEEFSDSTNLIVVKHQNKVIGGMFFMCHKKVFSDPWASSLKKYNILCPNNILYWEAIKYACRNNFEYFDFGRSTVNSGTFQFKKQWGAIPIQLNYQYYLYKAKRMPVVNAFNNKYNFAIRTWKKMPIYFANVLGQRAVKYLPEL